jgi:hypothetical protein
MSYNQGQLERARTLATRALSLAHRVGDRDAAVHAEWVLGYVEHAVGNLDAARDRLLRCVEGFKWVANSWGTGQALTGLAWVALATGDTDGAERLLDEAALALRDAGPWFLLLGLYIRAVLAVRRGNPDWALALMRESLTHVRELRDKFSVVYALVPLAFAAVLKGDHAWAARILGARDAVIESTGATVVDSSVQGLREAAEQEARARLGPDRWALAYAAGRSISIDSVLQDIDSVAQS